MWMLLAAIGCGAGWLVAPAIASPLPPIPAGSDALYIPGLTPNPIAFSEGNEPFDYNTFVPAGATLTGIVLFEPGTSTFSDLVYADANGQIHFASDDENGNFSPVTLAILPLLNIPPGITETGGWQPIQLPGAPLIYVASDISETPLPSSWTMMLIGLAVFWFAASPRLGKAAAPLAAA
jgi:hypothetical protein